MKFKTILFIMVMIPCFQISAQEPQNADLLNVYDRETIYIHYSVFGNGFVKDGLIIDIGPFGSNLAKELAGSKYAMAEMQKARKYKRLSSVTAFVATAFQITGIVLAFRDGNNNFDIASIVVGGICGIMAEGFNRSAMSAMNRAVWLYNRDVISGKVRSW